MTKPKQSTTEIARWGVFRIRKRGERIGTVEAEKKTDGRTETPLR